MPGKNRFSSGIFLTEYVNGVPFAIGYTFEDKPHHYLPDAVGTLTTGQPFIAEAGMEDDKRRDRNLAKAEAARRLARLQRGVFWIGTERTLTKRRHYNLVYLHARRKTFPAFADIATAVAEVWPWGEMVTVSEVASRLEHRFPSNLFEAAIWKVVGDSAAQGHLLVDLEQFTLSRTLPLARSYVSTTQRTAASLLLGHPDDKDARARRA